MLVFISIIALLTAFAATALYMYVKAHRLKQRNLYELLEQIRPLPIQNVVMLSRMRTEEQSTVRLDEILALLGGEQALDTLAHNVNAIMDVARYLSFFAPECETLTTQIRREAIYVQQLVKFMQASDCLRIRFGATRMLLLIAEKYCDVHNDISKLYVRVLDDVDGALRIGVRKQFAFQLEGDSNLVKYT